jgi:predicted TIM-barrel fold metal-dependent hydrolase
MRVEDLSGLPASRGFRLIDAHVHIWDRQDTPKIVREARRLGIGPICVSCLTGWDWSATTDYGWGNGLVFEAASSHEEVLGYVYVDPTQGEKCLEQVERYLGDRAMIGVKLWISCRANDPRVHPVAEVAAREGLLMLVHSWRNGTRLKKGVQTLPTEVAELAGYYPEVKFIMAHLGGDWENGVDEVSEQENLLLDTCGSINEDGMVEHAVELVGAERVVFGSDAPGSGYLPNLGKVFSARIPDDDKALILGGNMEGLLAGVKGG